MYAIRLLFPMHLDRTPGHARLQVALPLLNIFNPAVTEPKDVINKLDDLGVLKARGYNVTFITTGFFEDAAHLISQYRQYTTGGVAARSYQSFSSLIYPQGAIAMPSSLASSMGITAGTAGSLQPSQQLPRVHGMLHPRAYMMVFYRADLMQAGGVQTGGSGWDAASRGLGASGDKMQQVQTWEQLLELLEKVT